MTKLGASAVFLLSAAPGTQSLGGPAYCGGLASPLPFFQFLYLLKRRNNKLSPKVIIMNYAQLSLYLMSPILFFFFTFDPDLSYDNRLQTSDISSSIKLDTISLGLS